MVRHLLRNELVLAGLLVLEGLTKEGVERLLREFFDVRVLDRQVDADVGQTLDGVRFFGRLVENEAVLGRTAHLLEETEGLVEVDWHRDLREVFPYGVFQHGPDADLHLRVFEEGQFLSHWEREWMRASYLYQLIAFLFFKERILEHKCEPPLVDLLHVVIMRIMKHLLELANDLLCEQHIHILLFVLFLSIIRVLELVQLDPAHVAYQTALFD